MTTGVKSNICIGSFVTRLFQEEVEKHVIFTRSADHSFDIHSFEMTEETERNVSMRLAIRSRQISLELEFKRGFLIIFQSNSNLAENSKFFFLPSSEFNLIHQLFNSSLFVSPSSSSSSSPLSSSRQCEKCIACLHQRNAIILCNASNYNCIARISCKLTILNLLICM